MTVLLASAAGLPSAADSLIDVVVRRKVVEAERINSYELVPKDGRNLPGFSAGAHINVHLETGMKR